MSLFRLRPTVPPSLAFSSSRRSGHLSSACRALVGSLRLSLSCLYSSFASPASSPSSPLFASSYSGHSHLPINKNNSSSITKLPSNFSRRIDFQLERSVSRFVRPSTDSAVCSSASSLAIPLASDGVTGVSSPFLRLRQLLAALGDKDLRDFLPYVPAPRADALPIVASRLSLPAVAATVRLEDVLPRHVADKYSSPTPCLLKAPEEVGPVPRPCRLGKESQYHACLDRMFRAGMLTFTTEPKAVNGYFAVPKDEQSDRLIIDCRPANAFFVDSPAVSLPTPDLIAQLRAPLGRPLYVSKLDISDCYHRLVVPRWMSEYFALPAVPTSLFPGLAERFGSNSRVYPCLRTLPMGFSHSVFLAQTVHEHLAETETGLRREDRVMRGNDTGLDRLRYHLYIDDAAFISTSRSECRRALEAHIRTLNSRGLDVKPSKVVPPSCEGVDVVGVELHGRDGSFGLAPAKLRRLCSATIRLLERGSATGLELSVLLGRWTWAILPVRPAFAIFCSVYRFIEVAASEYTLWPSVKRELELVLSLAPLLWVDMRTQVSSTVVATDSSSFALGVTYAEVEDVQEVFEGESGAMVSPAGLSADGLDDQQVVQSSFALGAAGLHQVSHLRWKTAVSSRWRRSEHINVLECRAVLTALRWLLSRPSLIGRRVLLLSDSAVAVAALNKGRSSSYPLLRCLRAMSALLLASGTRLMVRWIPSSANPADAPSRLV